MYNNIKKLGLGIVAFEGTEHIKNITYELREDCDYIVVCLQRKSYMGNLISQDDIDECEHLLSVGLIDKIIWFEFDENYLQKAKTPEELKEAPRIIETSKRNFILDHLEENGCTHAIVIDSDEFYDKTQFHNAKVSIDQGCATIPTYCQYVNYWRDYRHYLIWPFKSYVPFITPIKHRFEFKCGCFQFAADLSRVYKLSVGDTYNVFSWNIVHMHHLSWIRKDIRKKIYSWSSGKYFTKQFLDFVYTKYLTWKEYECAYVTFGTPKGKVCVDKLPKQYIHPHYRLDETA